MVDASDHLCVYQKEKTPMHVWAFQFEVLILARQEGKCEFRIANCELGAISTGKLRIVKDSAIRNSQFEILLLPAGCRALSYREQVMLAANY